MPYGNTGGKAGGSFDQAYRFTERPDSSQSSRQDLHGAIDFFDFERTEAIIQDVHS